MYLRPAMKGISAKRKAVKDSDIQTEKNIQQIELWHEIDKLDIITVMLCYVMLLLSIIYTYNQAAIHNKKLNCVSVRFENPSRICG